MRCVPKWKANSNPTVASEPHKIMDSIDTWLDPIEVRQLADRLLQPNFEPASSMASDGFDDGFIGYEADSQLPVAADSPAQRSQRFCDWAKQHHSAKGVFILDHEGSVIFDEGGHGQFHFLARSLALAPRRVNASLEPVYLKIAAGMILQIIPLATAQHTFFLGLIISEALAPAALSSIREALSEVASISQSEV